MGRRAAPLLTLLLLLAAPPTWAHQASTTWSKIAINRDATVGYTLALSTRDLYEALGLDGDRDATDDEIRAGEGRLFEYVLGHIDVLGDGDVRCPLERRALTLVPGVDRKVELAFVARCPAPLGRVVIDYRLFFELDTRHVGMAQITWNERTVHRELRKGLGRFEWKLGDGAVPASLGLLDYVESGVEHIFTGYDHIAFVIGMLLVAAIRRRRDGWEARGARPGVGYVAKVVTAFTVAHSITLIAAALGVLELPTRIVESLIAASIIYIAAENVIVGDPRHRWPLAFGFGLVHGLGFATMLRPLLPPSGIVVPLLAFNLGVEIGQLAIVALLFPVLHVAASRSAHGYRRAFVLGGSACIALLGLLWLAERTLGVAILGRVLG